MATANVWAECVILNDGGTYTIMEYKFPAYQATPKVFDISNPRPSGMLTFNYSEGTAPIGGATVTATFLRKKLFLKTTVKIKVITLMVK